MSGVIKREITETVDELKELLKSTESQGVKERVQTLYWLKSEPVKTTQVLANLVGKQRTTVSRWLSSYRTGGIKALITKRTSSGRNKKLSSSVEASLKQELEDQEGFSSYKEIQTWLKALHNIDMSYTGVHQLVRYRLGGKLKVPRPVHAKQEPGVVEKFKKKLGKELKQVLEENQAQVEKYQQVRYWCGDESRIGLITLWARKLTGRGVQPVGLEQWCFDYIWLYGLVEPRSGDSFLAEFSHVDGVCFQEYLHWFSQAYPEQLHLIQLDNGRLHTWSELELPDNVILVFQPPYTPQVNPIERLWKEIKKHLKWDLFDQLEQLRQKLSQVLLQLTPSTIASVTGWDFILDALSVANI